MIVEIFVAQRQAVDALADQFPDAVFDPFRVAVIAEAGGELPQDAAALLDRMQQQSAGVAGDLAAIEARHHLAREMGCKREARLATL